MVLLILLTAGAVEVVVVVVVVVVEVVVVVCCRRSSLGLAVTMGNGFKMDSLSPCFRSMGLSEDREQEEVEEER